MALACQSGTHEAEAGGLPRVPDFLGLYSVNLSDIGGGEQIIGQIQNLF